MEQSTIISEPTYNYKDAQTDIKSIIHLINFLGDDLIGAEVGVFRADSLITILQNCPNIKYIHGIDSFKPYIDYLKEPYDGTPAYVFDEKSIEFVKVTSYHNQKYCGHEEKIIFHEMDSNEAAELIKNESLDFVFIDTYMTYEQAKNDIQVWYPKVRKNGLFSGHDWNSSQVQKALNEFRGENYIKEKMSTFDNCWVWYK